MEKLLVTFLTVLIGSISYGLFAKTPSLRAPIPTTPHDPQEVTLRFARQLETDPSPLLALQRHHESPPADSDPDSMIHASLSSRKNIPEKAAGNTDGVMRTVRLKQTSEPLRFSSNEEWHQWLHESVSKSGAGFLRDLSPEETPSDLLDALEVLAQIEREPELLTELGGIALETTETLQSAQPGVPSDQLFRILELYSKILPEQNPIRARIIERINRIR